MHSTGYCVPWHALKSWWQFVTEAYSNAHRMLSNIRTADVIKEINSFLWGTKWHSQVLAHRHYCQLMHLQEQKTEIITNYSIVFLYSNFTYDGCCDYVSVPPLIFPAISVDWYFFNVNMSSLLLQCSVENLSGNHFRDYLQRVPSFLPNTDLVIRKAQLLAQCCHLC